MQPQATGFMGQPQMMMSQPTGFPQQQQNYGGYQVSPIFFLLDYRSPVTDSLQSRQQY